MADTSGSAGEVRVRLTLDADDLKTQLNTAKQTIGSSDNGIPLVGMLDEATTVKKIKGQTGAISKGLTGEESRILLVGGLDKSKTIRAVNKAIGEIGEQSKGGLKSIVIPVQLDFSEEDSEKLDAVVQAGTASRKKPSPRKTQKRAMGGHVQPGVEYVVGEAGPERVRFGQSGTVIPNHNVKPIPRYHEGGYAIRGHRHSEDGKMYKDPRNGNWYPTIVRTPEERRLHQAMGSSRRNGTGQSWEVASIKRLPLAVRQGREQQQHYDPRIDPRPPYAHRGDPYAGASQVNEERRRRELADEDLVEPVYGPHGLPPATQDEFAAELSKFDDDITKTKSKRKLLRLQKARSQFLSQSAEALNSNQVRVRKVIPPAPRRRLEVKDDTGQAAQPAPSSLRGKRGLVETSISTGSRVAGGDPRAVRSQEAMQEAILSDLDPGPTATPERLAAASQAEYEHQARRVGRQHSIDQWITQHSGRPKNQRWKYLRDFGRSRLPEGVVRGQLALDDLTKPGLMGTVRRVDLGTMAMPGQDPRNHPWLSHLRAPAWGPLVASGEDPRVMPAATKGRRTVTPGQGEAPQQLILSANPERQIKDPRIGMHSTYAPNRDADMAAMLMARSIAQQGATGKVRMTPGAGPDFRPTAAPLPEDEPLKTQAQIRLYANPRGPMREPIEYEDGEWTPAFPKVAGTDPKGHWADPQTRERWVQGPPRTPYTPEWSRGRVSRVPLSMEDDDELQFKLKQDRKRLHKGFRIGRSVYNAERQVLTAQEEEELNELRRYGTEESERRWRELQTIKNIVRDASVIGTTTDDDEAKQEKIRTQDFLDAFSPALNSTAIAPVSSEVVGPHGSRSRLTAESFYRDPTRPPPPPDHVSRDRKITPRARRRMLNRLVPGLGTLIGAQSRADRRISNLPSEMGATVISGFTGEEVYATEEAMMELSKVSGLSRQMAAKWHKTYGKPGEPLPRWEQASPGLKRDLATIYPEVLELDAEAQDETLQGIYEMEVLRPDRGQVSKASKEIKALKKQGRPRDALGGLTLNYSVAGMADQQTERYGDMLKPEARAKVAKTLSEHDRRVEEAKKSGNQAKVEVFTAARQEFLDNFLAENPRFAQRIERGLDPSERIRSSGIGIGDDGELLDAEIDPETGLPRYSMPDARAMLLRTTMQSLGTTRQVTATEIRLADLDRRIEGAEEAVQVATHGEHESAAKRDVAIEAAKTERSQLKAARTEAKKAIGDILAPKGYSMGGPLTQRLMQSKIQKAYDDGKYEEGQRLQKQLEQAKGGWEEQEDDQQTQSPMVQRAVKGLLPGKTFAGGGIRTAIRGLFSARQSAKGHAYGSMPELAAHPGSALMGERGPEDVFGADGTVEKVGQNGPEVVVPSQDVVIAPNHWDGDPGSIPGVSKPPKERDFVAELKGYQSEVAPKEGITGIPEWLKKGYAKGGGLLGRGVGMPAHQLLAEKLAEKSAKRKQQERQTPEWLRRSLEMNQGKDLTGYARGGWQPKSPIMYDMDLPGEWVEYRKQAPPGTSWQKPYPTQLEGARDRLSKSGGDAIRPWLPEMRRFGRGGKWSPQHGDIMLNRAGWVVDAETKRRISMSQEDYNRLPVFDPNSEQGSARGRTQLNRALRTSPNLGQQTLGLDSPSQYPGHGRYTNVYTRFREQSQRTIGPVEAPPEQLSIGSAPSNVPLGPYGIGSHMALRGRTLHRAGGTSLGPQVINLPGPRQTGPQGFQAQVNNWMAGNAGSPQQVNQAAQQHQQNAAQQQQAAQQAANQAGRNAAGQMGAQAWMAFFQGFGINNNLAQQAANQAGQQQGQQQQGQQGQGQQQGQQGQGQQQQVPQPGGQPNVAPGVMPLGTAGRRAQGYIAVHGGQMTQQQQQVLGRMGLGGGGTFGTEDYMEQIAGIRSGVSEQLSLTPVRALSVSVGQIFQQLGGRAGVQKKAVLANQAAAEAQKSAGQLDRYRQERSGIEAELFARRNDVTFQQDTTSQGQAALQKKQAQLRQAEVDIEPVVQQKVADAKIAEKKVSTGAQRLGLQGLGLAGIVTGTVVFSKAMEVVSGGMAALADVVDKATDELTGFVRTSNMAADQLAAVAAGGTGGQAEVAAAQARFGMATSTEELDRRARLQAGATNFQTIRDQLRAERNFGERGRDEGVITGFNNGPLAGTPIIGDWLGWIGQQQSITQLLASTGAREGSYSGNVGLGGVRTSDFAAALGLEDISALRPANKTTENDEGERIYRAGVTVEEMIQKINRNRRPEDRYDVPSADVVSQRLLDQGMGRTEATTTESQEAQLDQVKALYAELNDNQKKVNKTLGKFTVNEDEAFSDESKATAAFFRDKNLFGLADQIEQFGVVFETNAKDLNAALETTMENAATGSTYQDVGRLLEGMRPQLDARVRGIERQAAYQRDTLIPANFARSFIQSPTTPTTPLQGIAATGPFGASTPTAGLEEYGETIETLTDQVDAFVEQGLERMREEMDIPDSVIKNVKDLGDEIRSLNEMSERMSLGMDQERYNEQLFLSRRALGDAVGLVGQQSASYSKLTDVSRRKVDGETEVTYEYEQQVIQATKLGQLQAAQVSDQREMARLNRLQALDQRELARISLARSQRELNLQIALSRLQSPGETPQERAVRRREAELIAREKQRELDINKRTTERGFGVEDIGYRSQQRGFQIEDIGYRRALRDALKAAKLSESERTIQLELRGVQKAIQLTQVVQQTKTGYLDLGMTVASQVQEAVMGVQETLEAQSGQFADDFKGEVEKIFAPIKREVIETLGLINGDGGSSSPAPDDITNGTGGGHTQKKGTDAAGGIFDAKGATSFIAGEAGSEHVVVLRNPRLGMTSGGPAGGGGGVMNKTVNVTINASVRGDGDIDRLVDKVKRAIHDEAAVVGVA